MSKFSYLKIDVYFIFHFSRVFLSREMGRGLNLLLIDGEMVSSSSNYGNLQKKLINTVCVSGSKYDEVHILVSGQQHDKKGVFCLYQLPRSSPVTMFSYNSFRNCYMHCPSVMRNSTPFYIQTPECFMLQ